MAEELTLEQLHGLPDSDPEAEKKVAESLQLAEGTYNTTPPLYVSRTKNEETGRSSARFFGTMTGTGRVAGLKGKAGFRLSWEPVYKESGRVDNQTKLFHDAKATYRRAMSLPKDAVVKTVDVLDFLEKYAVGVHLRQGDTDNWADAITNARE